MSATSYISGEELFSEEFDKAVGFLDDYMREHGPAPFGWYVGISDDPRRRLKEHNFNGTPAAYTCTSADHVARAVEKFLKSQGCEGGVGGGDGASICVYVYKITGTTIE